MKLARPRSRWWQRRWPDLEPLESRLTPAAHDTLPTALPLTFDGNQQAQAAGALVNPNQVDLYRVLLNRGDLVAAAVRAYTPTTPLDSGLRVFDGGGHQIAFNDNGGGPDPGLMFTAAVSGPYFVGVSSAADFGYNPLVPRTGAGGQSTGTYTLNLARSPGAESGNNGTIATADVINGAAHVQGVVGHTGHDYFRLTVDMTGQLTVSVTPTGTGLQPRLTLYGAAGQLLIQADGAGATAATAQLDQHLQSGTYYLGVSVIAGAASAPAYVLDSHFDPTLPPFQPQPVQGNPYCVVVSDLTNDGDSDALVLSTQNGSSKGLLSVLLGRGDGTFQSASSYTLGSGPSAVAVADFNRDGTPDIVVANSGDNAVSVMLGSGDGTFGTATSYQVGNGPDAVAVGDFNGDGTPDIVTANADGTVSVLLGSGEGGFQTAFSYAVGDRPQSVAVGDFNGDGRPDIVTANAGDGTVSVLLSQSVGRYQGGGNFQAATSYAVGSDPLSVAVADFNGDGRPDIVAANAGDGTVSVLLGQTAGTFQAAVSYAVGGRPSSVAVGDFDADGTPDVVTANHDNGTVSVLPGKGKGTFRAASSYRVGTGPLSVAVGDVNNDGVGDIVTANNGDGTISVLPGKGDGTFQSAPSYPVGSVPNSIAAGAFTRNRNDDVVTTNSGDNTVSVMLGRGDGTFGAPAAYPVGNGPAAVAVGDFNHDSVPDIVTANADGTVSVLLSRGDGTFLPAVSYGVGNAPDAVAVGDFNRDGVPDIVTASAGGMVSVLLGKGDGTFGPAVSYAVGNDPVSVAVGDFNGDGTPDIVTANREDNTVSVLPGQGDGTFRRPLSYPVGPSPVSVAVGDFNGDGLPDLVTANANGTVSVLLGQGNGLFQPAISYAVGSDPKSVAVGDFNNDGVPDVVTANGDDTVSVLLGQGQGTFQAAVSYAVGSDPRSVAVGYFDRPGIADIVTANSGDNTVSVLLGHGDGVFNSGAPGNGIAVRDTPIYEDLNGDGAPDELILDSSGELLFRRGLGSDGHFAPPMTINPRDAARDVTAFETANGWTVAAVDKAGNGVSLYTWDQETRSFHRTFAFPTGRLPVRIAAADLDGQQVNGHSLDDLVVLNDIDNGATIALQQPDGTFTTLTVPVGVAPSDIAFLNISGQTGPDVAITDQVSGDVAVLLNDATPSSPPTFSQEDRYRAGSGVFDINDDPGTHLQTVVSRLQTVALAVGNFTSADDDDVVVLNRSLGSFTLLPGLGQGRLDAPQTSNTYLTTGAEPDQVIPITFPGDSLTSVAVLMGNLNQVWVYRNNGDGTFAEPIKVDAGAGPTGFSVAQVSGRLALLVGDDYGDVLVLIYDGHGGFAPDRAGLKGAPLAVGTVAGTGQQYAVVANQNVGQVLVYGLTATGDHVGKPVTLSSDSSPLAPGAIQIFYVPGDSNPYMAVADSLSNALLLYQYDATAGEFGLLGRYGVGDDPISITVYDINGDGIPDLAVANRGSNDVSILIGSLDPTTHQWTATSYQRLGSGGGGPVGVSFVVPTFSASGPDLVVTNGDGRVAVIPGIGSDGAGSGFFAGASTQVLTVLGTPLGPLSSGIVGTTEGLFRVDTDGLTTSAIFSANNLTAFAVASDGIVLAGFSDGTVEELRTEISGHLAVLLTFRDAELSHPNSLDLVTIDGQTEVLATSEGESSLFAFTLSDGVAVAETHAAFEVRDQSLDVQTVGDSGLFLVAVFETDAVPTGDATAEAASEGLFAPEQVALVSTTTVTGEGGGGDHDEDEGPAGVAGAPVGPSPQVTGPGSPLNDLLIGVGDGLRTIREQLRKERGAEEASRPAQPDADPAGPQEQLPPPTRAEDAEEDGLTDVSKQSPAMSGQAADAVFARSPSSWDQEGALLLAVTMAGYTAVGFDLESVPKSGPVQRALSVGEVKLRRGEGVTPVPH